MNTWTTQNELAFFLFEAGDGVDMGKLGGERDQGHDIRFQKSIKKIPPATSSMKGK